MKRKVCMFFAVVALAAAALHITKEIAIGGQGGWDYLTVDSAAQRLYVSHSSKVEVVDLAAGKPVGEIPDTPGVHGIAIAPALNRGFVSNGRGNSVTIFDLKTLKTLSQVKTGENPDAIRFDPASGRVFTFNGRSKDATAINAATGVVDGTIPLGGKPEFSAADGAGLVFVNIEDTSEVAVIDAKALKVVKRYSLSPCDGPSGLAFDAKTRTVFSVCSNKLMAISDPASGKVTATLPIGAGSDGAGFDPGTRTVYSSNGGDGTLTVVKEAAGKWAVAETIPTARGARTMTVDESTHAVYLPANAGEFKILVLNQ